jgi:hypothetical protein
MNYEDSKSRIDFAVARAREIASLRAGQCVAPQAILNLDLVERVHHG